MSDEKLNSKNSCLTFSKQKFTEIIEDVEKLALPIGFLVVTGYPEYKIIYANSTFMKIFEAEKNEFLNINCDEMWRYIYSEDVERVKKIAESHNNSSEPYEIIYRTIKRNGSYVWLKQRTQHVQDDSGAKYEFIYYRDVTDEKNSEQLIKTAIRGYDISIWEWIINDKICYHSVRSSRCIYNDVKTYTNYPDCMFETKHYHPDSVDEAKRVFERVLSGEKIVEATLQTYDARKNEYWWESVCYTSVFDNDGKLIKAVAVGKDVSVQKNLEMKSIAWGKKYETLVNTIPGGVGLFKGDARYSPIYLSDKVPNLSGMTRTEFEDAIKISTFSIFHPDDIEGMRKEIIESRAQMRKLEYTHRIRQKNGDYKWLRVSGEWITDFNYEQPILYVVFIDVNEQIKAEQALRESELRYATAIKSSNMNIWEYDYEADTMSIFSKSPRISGEKVVLSNYSRSLIENGHLREDSALIFLSMIKRLRAGESVVTADLWIRDQNLKDFWCERVVYTNIFDEKGKPLKVFCVGRDVTREKEAEKRYYEELSYREAMQNATVSSININLTQNIIIEHKSNFSELAHNMELSETLQSYFDTVAESITPISTRKEFSSLFNRYELLRRFASGETTVNLEVTREIEGRQYWTLISGHMMKNHEKNEVIAFVYTTDITKEKVMHNVMNAIVKTDYDFLVVIDAIRNTGIKYNDGDAKDALEQEYHNFDEEISAFLRENVCKEDMEQSLREVSLKNILAQLEDHEVYNVYFSMPNPNGGIFKKQLRFSYMNRDLKMILMARVDITDAFYEEEKKKKELVIALGMAERANASKSEFLSRVSHEIRTPMNVIIGLAQVAEYNLLDVDVLKECIDKSKEASKYLLTLINDILEMSKIESGRVSLKKTSFVCRTFLESIKTIIIPQAEAKEIEYSLVGLEKCSNAYIGDTLRLQQILINILSNAVKFTQKGGKICLDISETSHSDNNANVEFKITDNGIGICPEFIPMVFKPFEQEHNGTTTVYGGNGLGLAISQSNAMLMGGNISVSSVIGKGTTFIVKIPLGIPKREVLRNINENAGGAAIEYNFSGKKILLVEDHPMNVMVAKKLLEYKRASVDVAENGQIALDMVSAAKENEYDAILMDIRMPVMDGLESASKIRKLNKKFAKTVPIIAMSANAFDEDMEKSKAAGMNVHLAKPIDAETLYNTLYNIFLETEKTIED